MTTQELAEAVEVDPKTVERWISNGRVPHQRHRRRASEVLDVDQSELWPEVFESAPSSRPGSGEIRAIYPDRGAVPAPLWRQVGRACDVIELLVYSGLFLVDNQPDLPASIGDAASKGARVRLLFGDPASEAVHRRGIDEGIGPHLQSRIELSLTYFAPLLRIDGIEVRLHQEPLYNSIYRFDSQMLVNLHMSGSGAPHNPVIHLSEDGAGTLFGKYHRSFEHVWSLGSPLESSPDV
jgi:hypothetical protein